MKRLFRHLNPKNEGFLKENGLFGDLNVNTNVSNSKTKQTTNEDNTAINKILNSQDILDSINSSYDKTIEVLNKVSQEVNKSSEAIASSKTVQSNVINLKGAKLTGTSITAKQANRAFINEMNTDNKTKAIVADMLGVTQGSESVQETIQIAVKLPNHNNKQTNNPNNQ
jgi:hypothetical protein